MVMVTIIISASANSTSVTRIALSSFLSDSGTKFFRMFSTKVVEGASSVALAVSKILADFIIFSK